MSGEDSSFKFYLHNRNAKNITKDNFNANKKEKFLYKYFSENGGIFAMDREADNPGVITYSEIQRFLQFKDMQKKGITEEDIISYLNKYKELAPTKQETLMSSIDSSYKDENGNSMLSDEMKEIFSIELKNKTPVILVKDITDESGNIKKGFELFDLNGDNRLDDYEKRFLEKNKLYYDISLDDIQKYLSAIDSNTESDGSISLEDKQKIYQLMIEDYHKEKFDKLSQINVRTNKENVVTDAVKDLFKDSLEITADDLTDSEGNIKAGLEIFDLNNDGKLDNIERDYFVNGGHPLDKGNTTIKLDQFIQVISDIDNFGYNKMTYPYDHRDKDISDGDKQRLYAMLEAAYHMVDNIKNLPQDVQQEFLNALGVINFRDLSRIGTAGAQSKNQIFLDTRNAYRSEVATVLIHELTHFIISKNSDMNFLTQEVETFYMQYKLYETMKNDPNYSVNKDNFFDNMSKDYLSTVDELKRKNPDLSEKDIAIRAFIKHQYSSYNGRPGYPTMSEAELRAAEYYPMGGIFK